MPLDWTKDLNDMAVLGKLTSMTFRKGTWIARVETKTTDLTDAVEFLISPELFASRELWPIGGRIAIKARTAVRARGFTSHFAREIYFEGEQPPSRIGARNSFEPGDAPPMTAEEIAAAEADNASMAEGEFVAPSWAERRVA